MGLIDANLMRVRACATETGTYTNIGYVRSADYTRGREGSTTVRFFGGDATKAGGKTLSGSMPCWYDTADAGQKMLRDAYDDDGHVFLQFCPEGTEAGAKVHQFEAVIDEDGFSNDSEGEFAEGTLTFTGTPSTFKVVTLAGS